MMGNACEYIDKTVRARTHERARANTHTHAVSGGFMVSAGALGYIFSLPVFLIFDSPLTQV